MRRPRRRPRSRRRDDPGREQAVGARLGVRDETADHPSRSGSADEEALGAPGQDDVLTGLVDRLPRRAHPRRRGLDLVEWRRSLAGPVLDREPGDAGRDTAPHVVGDPAGVVRAARSKSAFTGRSVAATMERTCVNLAFYLSLRRRDIRDLQMSLIPWGLSSLGRLESKTLENIDAVIASLTKITAREDIHVEYPPFESFMTGMNQLDDNSNLVLGENPEHRYTRIMVTLPTEAADNDQFVIGLIEHGMNVARINCAHDDPSIWFKMIQHINQANQKLKRNCKILMDVAGPKIRTQQLNKKSKKQKVNVGDVFFLTDNKDLERYGDIKIVLGCSIPEIIPTLKKGDGVLYDDGKMVGKVETVTDQGVVVKVENVKDQKGIKLKAEKGINFPGKDLRIDLLTEKDLQDLDFVCEHADIIGCSLLRDQRISCSFKVKSEKGLMKNVLSKGL